MSSLCFCGSSNYIKAATGKFIDKVGEKIGKGIKLTKEEGAG